MQHPPPLWPRWMICHSNKGSNEKEATRYRVAFFVRIKQKKLPLRGQLLSYLRATTLTRRSALKHALHRATQL